MVLDDPADRDSRAFWSFILLASTTSLRRVFGLLFDKPALDEESVSDTVGSSLFGK